MLSEIRQFHAEVHLVPHGLDSLCQFCLVVRREKAGSLRSPLRGTRRPVCAPQLSCVYANAAFGVDIDSCSLGTAGDWGWCLSGVLLSAPLPQPVCYRTSSQGRLVLEMSSAALYQPEAMLENM